MAEFHYKARDQFARLVTGTITAQRSEDAAGKLKGMGYVVIAVNEAHDVLPMSELGGFRRVSLEQINTFTRQLYSLLRAGIPLLESLEAIALQVDTRYFRTVINELIRDIKAGRSFSDALKNHPRVFNEIYTSMIKAAESSGMMVEITYRLTQLLEQEIDTRSRIKAATRYPLLALFVLCVGFFILVTFVIPRYAAIYSQFSVALPLPTQILIAVNVLITRYWLISLVIVVLVGIGMVRFVRSPLGKPLWDNFKLQVPVFGPLLKMLAMSRFARITSILMRSGVPILEVLDLVGHTSGNIIIERGVHTIRENVNQGKGIAEPMKVTNLFSPIVVQMVGIGEQTGKVDELLLSVADYYDRESGYMIKNLTTYIEPLLIFILSIMVLIMALGIFMPMWNLIRVFKPV